MSVLFLARIYRESKAFFISYGCAESVCNKPQGTWHYVNYDWQLAGLFTIHIQKDTLIRKCLHLFAGQCGYLGDPYRKVVLY